MRTERRAAPGLLLACLASSALAQTEPVEEAFRTTVVAEEESTVADGRATATVSRSELERQLPRSAPDALRYEPGVFVQQTAHGQASAFLRGLTGQQTLLLFDGVRLNNGTWRQGPNQYFFTLDSKTLESIEVLRGGASTRFGSDALGGVILARPRAARFTDSFQWRPRVSLLGGTSDDELGGRAELELSAPGVSFLGGVGARRVGLLESGGPVFSPENGALPEVPRFAEDGRTQLGTGFRELTADGRLRLRPDRRSELTAAVYAYRQYDAPRTDQCPPPTARFDECLLYEEQFRTLAYGRYERAFETGALQSFAATLSYQQQHERRRNDRPASRAFNLGRDDVDTFGMSAGARWRLGPALVLRTGADTHLDLVSSRAWVGFTDNATVVAQSRGQYLEGSRYLYGGAFATAAVPLLDHRLVVRAGARQSWISARAPADSISGSAAVDEQFFPLVGHAGLEARVLEQVTLLTTIDHSFRAPNLDDLTSRQQTGPGFQFENPALGPERATSVELGARLDRRPLQAELWLFRTWLNGAVGKRPRDAADCPPETPACLNSNTRFQLVNAADVSDLWGAELSARWRPLAGLDVQAAVSFAFGEGPSLVEGAEGERVPLSRVPPLNGSIQAQHALPFGLVVGAAARWAGPQRRLALADRSDARIPVGGTPGFLVLDARASYRLGTRLVLSAVLENLLDSAYRHHGSSVNGPGRGVRVQLEWVPFTGGSH